MTLDEWDPEVLVQGPEQYVGKLISCGCGNAQRCRYLIPLEAHDVPVRCRQVISSEVLLGPKWAYKSDCVVVHPEPADAP